MGIFEIIKKGGLLTVKFGAEGNVAAWLLGATFFMMIVGYLLGSINGAHIVCKYMKLDNITNHGSKNAGMTNMARVYGAKAAILTTLIDMAKTAVAVSVAYILCPVLLPYIAGLFTLIGHAWPVFYKFKGGKGIIVSATMILMTSWPTFVAIALIWGIVVLFTKYVSLGSIISALMYPFILERINAMVFKLPQGFDVIIAFVMGAMVLFLHRSNIKRLGNGTENKIGKKKKDNGKDDGKNGN